MKQLMLLFFFLCLIIISCEKAPNNGPSNSEVMVKFKFKFDPAQERLNSLGQVTSIPSENGTFTPDFSAMSTHFIELAATDFTPYQSGQFIYKGEEVAANNPNPFNFTTAIDFDKAIIAGETESFLEIPLSDLTPGTYKNVRVSVAYQNYDVRFNLKNIPVIGDLNNQLGTVAAFVGYNTDINTLKVGDKELEVNDTKLQGFWAFESKLTGQFEPYNQISFGQAPNNTTTVVNPFPDFPIPQGSCVVTGSFDSPLVITGDEKEDIQITLSFSINNSFEWVDLNGNGEWDLDVEEPTNSEPVLDMGLRGLKAYADL